MALGKPFSINGLYNISGLNPDILRDIIAHKIDYKGTNTNKLNPKEMKFSREIIVCQLVEDRLIVEIGIHLFKSLGIYNLFISIRYF